mmetsp:Transcript_2347/g.4992  ORF Transcript_2347/g.4992 Transcript_2347/m.4992 type:complete len:101 (+) Transcript_2347:3-305(+)
MIGSVCMYFLLRQFVRHIQLVAEVGDAYHKMVQGFSTAESFVLSQKVFQDPTALQELFTSNTAFKSHVWVLFEYPVDSALVWTIITSMGVAVLLAILSAL